MLKKLGIIEKIQLWIKGKNDAKNDMFQKIDVTTYQKEEKMPSTINEETVTEYEKIPIVAKKNEVQISAFVLIELQEFKNEREYLISHKKFKIRKQEGGAESAFRFQNGINFLEKNLKDVNAQMFIKETKYKKRKDWLESEIDRCKNGLTSVFQLKEYEAEMEAARQLYLKEQEKNYMNAIFLIHEEIRVLEQMKALLRLKKNRHFLRIRYYYQSAQMAAKGISISVLTDEVLKEIGELVELGDDYELILKNAHEIDQEFQDRYVVSTIE